MIELRFLLTLLLAGLAVALVVDGTRRRRLVPPLLRAAPGASSSEPVAGRLARRVLAVLVLGTVLMLSVAVPIGTFGLEVDFDPGSVSTSSLFLLHALFGASLLALYALGYLPSTGRTSLSAQVGLRAPSVGLELALGAAAGVGVWLIVIVLLLFLSALVSLFGGMDALPRQPPGMVLWIAGLPLWVRLAVSLSAGFFEEVFFRGFLQPRIGVPLSTAFFAFAHLSYDQPFMLVGITVLSLLFSWMVIWRRSVWAAASAHAVFDAIQLLVLIPLITRFFELDGGFLALL